MMNLNPAKVLQPSEQSLRFPAFPVARKGPPSWVLALRPLILCGAIIFYTFL